MIRHLSSAEVGNNWFKTTSIGRLMIKIIWVTVLLIACRQVPLQPPPQQIIVDDLINPIGLAQLPDGGLLIAEMGTGEGDSSAGITLITADGQQGRLVSGIPSTRDSGDLAGAALVSLSPDSRTIYIGHFNAGRLWTISLDPEQSMDLPGEPMSTADLDSVMFPQVIDKLVNPFDMAFDNDGLPVVTDASMNGVARPNAEGKTHFIHLFNRLPDPTHEERTIDAVPTGIARFENEYLVTLTGGCPFPAGGGQLVSIGQTSRPREVLSGLNMPVDVAVDDDNQIWLLEFAQFHEGGDCFAGGDYLPNSGQLSRLTDDGRLQPVVTGLQNPGAFILAEDGSILVSEVFPGRVLQIRLPENENQWPVNLNSEEAIR